MNKEHEEKNSTRALEAVRMDDESSAKLALQQLPRLALQSKDLLLRDPAVIAPPARVSP